MGKTIHAILRVKNETRSWFAGKILKSGEFAYETDFHGVKIGDGITIYSALPYLIPSRRREHNKYLKVVQGEVVWADGYDDTAIWTAVNGKQDVSTLETDVAALGFVKNTVNNLLNYYLKTETYTQAEVNALISGMSGFTYEIYASLSDIANPAHNVLYLIGPTGSGSDKYEEYVYPVNDFVKIGDTSIDLSGYVTTSDLNTALAVYTTTTDLTTLLAGYQTKIDANNKLDYSLLDNTPTIPSDTNDLTNGAGFITSSDIPSDVSDFNNDAGYITINDVPAQVQSDWDEDDSNNPAYIKNKPTIPSDTGDLTNGAGFITSSDIPTDVSDFNNDAGYITSADIPPIPNGTYIDIANAGWGPNQVTGAYLRAAYFYNGEVPSKVGDYVYSKSTRCLHKITSIMQVGGENVANADFIAYFSGFDGSYSSLSGKPTLGTAAALNVPASGDAATIEVVKGDDSRLSDARTPTSHTHTTSDITDFPTIPDAQIQSDWNQSDNTKKDYIKNKPTIPSITGKADKVSGATSGNLAGLDSYGNLTDSGIAATDASDAVSKKHSHTNKTILDEIPSSLGTAGQAIVVNSGGTGLEFATVGGGGGFTDYNFTHVANTTVSTSTTITFAANTRGSQMVSTSADLAVTFAVNNGSDNYLWIRNTGAADIDITISAVTAGGSPVANIYIPTDGITVAAGNVCEIGIIVNADGAFITSRSDLSL